MTDPAESALRDSLAEETDPQPRRGPRDEMEHELEAADFYDEQAVETPEAKRERELAAAARQLAKHPPEEAEALKAATWAGVPKAARLPAAEEAELEAAILAGRPMAPVFEAHHGLYRMTWGDLGIRIEIDHVRAERGGDLKGEVTLSSTINPTGTLSSSSANLSGARARSELAAYLAKRTPGQAIDWPTIIEWACVQTIRAFRAGEPAVQLRDIGRPIAAGYALRPTVLADEPTIWFGDGGDLKSMIALAAAATMSGHDVLGLPIDRVRRILYLDFEFSGSEHRDRLERLCGSEMPDILYARMEGALINEVERVQRIVRDEQRDFLIVDSVAFACHDAPELATSAQEYFRALRRIGLGSLNLAHTTKADGADQKPFGSVFWHNGVRSSWFVKREGDGDRQHVALFNRKANTGPISPPIGFDVVFEPDRGPIRISLAEVGDMPGLAERLPMRVRIAREVKAGALTVAEIASRLDASLDTVRKTADRSDGKDLRKVIGTDGIWRIGLATKEPDR